jgi:hypothetical protein
MNECDSWDSSVGITEESWEDRIMQELIKLVSEVLSGGWGRVDILGCHDPTHTVLLTYSKELSEILNIYIVQDF